MKNSTFIVCSFLGLILLAASLVWFPTPASLPKEVTGTDDNPVVSGKTDPGVIEEKSAGTTGSSGEEQATESKTVQSEPAIQPDAKNEFESWPEPALAFVVTGEQHGYFEPCGCTANQLGGMTRRAGLFASLRKLGWNVRGIDVGGISREIEPHATGPQAIIKFETTLEALRQLGYVGLAMGPEEVRLDPSYLLSQHLADGEEPLAFLGANLLFFGAREVGTPLTKTIVDVGGVKVGITSVMSETIRKDVLPDDSSNTDVQWSDPQEALKSVLKEFDEEGVTFRILLSQGTIEESRQLAKDFQEFQVIVTANGFGEGEPKPELIGNVRLIQPGEKGKVASVFGIYPADKENPVRYRLVTLTGTEFGDDPAMIELLRAYQERLHEQKTVIADNPVGHPSGASFVGATKCGECHTKAMAVWEQSAHAHAFESLDPANQRDGHERLHGIPRMFDPECLSCHVTGWDARNYTRYRSGFLNAEFAESEAEKGLEALMAGNQCENCHGPGSRHIELIEAGQTEAAAKEVRVTLEQAKNVTCPNCHDVDNSPDFKFDEYWEQIKHPGKD